MDLLGSLCCCARPKVADHGREKTNAVTVTVGNSPESPESPPPSEKVPQVSETQALDVPRTLQELLQRLTTEQRDIVVTTKDCAEAVQSLQKKLGDRGLESKTSKLGRTLHILETFVGGITTLSQGLGPASEAALIAMGSIKMVLSMSARYVDVVERMVDCLTTLVNTFPRLNEYLGLFPIPKLQDILSKVCVECVLFCVSCAEFLDRSAVRTWLGNFVGLIWSAVDKDLETAQKNISALKEEFDEEVRLAYTRTVIQWQEKMGTLIASGPQPGPVTAPHTILRPRNRNFVGRAALLNRLDKLFSGVNVASCSIVGLGGMGKSQVALELGHRVKARFDHVVWFHTETELDLTKSFVEMAHRFGFYDKSLPFEENVELTRRFLNTTDKRCLLIYDNVDETRFLPRYWPESESVSVLVTTQRSQTGLTSESIPIGAMDEAEGAELLLRLSETGPSSINPEDANKEAKWFSESLGGLPLAIAHYAGYMAQSKMSLNEFRAAFRDHFQDSHIWHSQLAGSLDGYSRTLESVWSLALSKLSPEARQTLNMLVYLREDAAPELMLLGSDGEEQWKQLMRLRPLVMELQDRQLVERTGTGANAMLRTHPAFKRTVILRLAREPEDRQKAFDRAVASIRRSLPGRSLDKGRSGVDLQPVIHMCLPHVLSLMKEFQLADPPLKGSLEFADVLCDSSFYLWEEHLLADAFSAAELGENICSDILGKEDDSPLHIQLFGLLANLHHTQGRRAVAHDLYKKVIAGRRAHIARLPPEQVTSTDKIDLARSFNDFSEWLVDEERLDEALGLVQQALAIYTELGSEETLTFRFGNQYGTLSLIYCGQRRMEEALDYARRSVELIVKLYGERYYFTTIFQLHHAVVLLVAGKASEALPVFDAVLQTRVDLRGESDTETLEAMMWLAVGQYHLSKLDEAEASLEKALSLKEKACWTHTGPARALLWWAAVLAEQGKAAEAEAAVERARREAPDVLRTEKRSIQGHLEVCERAIYCWQYCRCTGVFRVERAGGRSG